MPQIKINRFVDSVRPEVALKKDAVCSLKLHFYGCLRQYANAIEYKAQIDPERFVYASEKYFVDYCKRFTRKDGQGKAYDKRMVRRCKKFLREVAIIGEQVMRVRKGKLREGFIVAAHDSIAKTEGNTCTILPESSLASSLCCSLASSLASSVPNEENGASEFPSEFPSDTPQSIDNHDSYGNGEQKSFRKVKTVSAPNAVNAVKSVKAENAETGFDSEFESDGMGFGTRLKNADPLTQLNIISQNLGRGRRW